MTSYFEPEGTPEEVKQVLASKRRVIRIRFDTPQDVDDFVRKTGIHIPHRKSYKIEYPEQGIF